MRSLHWPARTKITALDPLEYLVRRCFPTARALRAAPFAGGISGDRRKELLSKIREYENELRAKTPEELQALFEQERAKESEELTAKAELEEQARFFNQPHVRADFEHWSKAAHWTLDEAIALSFGKPPELVSWEKVKPYVRTSRFAYQYHRRRDLALRAVACKQLFDPVLPGVFLDWAKRTEITVAPELERAVTTRGVQVADWKTQFDELSAMYDQHRDDWRRKYDELRTMYDEHRGQWMKLAAEKNDAIEPLAARIKELESTLSAAQAASEKSLGARERESLLKLIIGMALGGYGYDPHASRSEQPSQIAGDLARHGLALDVDTVRKWLRTATDLLLPKGEASD